MTSPCVVAPTGPTTGEMAERLGIIRETLRRVGGPVTPSIVGVTKGFGPSVVAMALAAGLTDLGENYAGELVSKAQSAPAKTRWHFLGALQTGRTASLAPHVAVWEAIDRARAADAVAARRPGAAVFIQVNVSGDPRKHGCALDAAGALVEHCRRQALDVRGLMTVGPVDDPDGARRCFSVLARTGRLLDVEELSMGMSDDYAIAAEEGATSVRLGRALFGPRPSPPTARR